MDKPLNQRVFEALGYQVEAVQAVHPVLGDTTLYRIRDVDGNYLESNGVIYSTGVESCYTLVDEYLELPMAIYLPYDKRKYRLSIEKPALIKPFGVDVWQVAYEKDDLSGSFEYEHSDLAIAICEAWLKMKDGEKL